jgi:tetratricopeptide (TPR) repeat protein
MISSPPKPREQDHSDLISPGGPSQYRWAKFRKALLSGSLALGGLIGSWQFIHSLGWLWFILSALLIGGGWLGVAAYSDYLVRQGRYDQASRLVSILSMSSEGRNRLRVDMLIAAGRYNEAALVLRDLIHSRRGKITTRITKVKGCFDLENLGNVLMETGRFEEAQRFFLDAARLCPYQSVTSIGMAETVLRQGGLPESALAHAEKALNLFQRGTERITSGWQLGVIMATKAWALAACGDGVEAQKAIEVAMKSPARKTKGPLAQVHYKAGMSLRALFNHQGAMQHFALGAKLDSVGRWGRLCDDALRQAGAEASPLTGE